MLVGLSACASRKPELNLADVPVYPGAQNLKSQDLNVTDPQNGRHDVFKLITFTTADKPAQVLAFYEENLRIEKWTLDEKTDNSARFSAFVEDLQPRPFRNVLVKPVGSQTSVEIELGETPGR